MFVQWATHPDLVASFASVRFALSGAAPLSVNLAERYREMGVTLFEGYGLTETAPCLTLNVAGAENGSHAGTVGRPLPGIEIQLRNNDGSEVAAEDEDPGQLYVRGPNLFSGYWPDGEGGPDGEGWFATGDIAILDKDGYLRLVGRTSDLVIVNGFNVYPAEVERVLSEVAGVAEVAVLGVPDERAGEAVVAFVVPAPDVELDADDLLAHAARSLAKFKLPRSVTFVDSLPHTPTGKVQKWRLKERFTR
jgi:long-chain acyl-CoA synthetase